MKLYKTLLIVIIVALSFNFTSQIKEIKTDEKNNSLISRKIKQEKGNNEIIPIKTKEPSISKLNSLESNKELEKYLETDACNVCSESIHSSYKKAFSGIFSSNKLADDNAKLFKDNEFCKSLVHTLVIYHYAAFFPQGNIDNLAAAKGSPTNKEKSSSSGDDKKSDKPKFINEVLGRIYGQVEFTYEKELKKYIEKKEIEAFSPLGLTKYEEDQKLVEKRNGYFVKHLVLNLLKCKRKITSIDLEPNKDNIYINFGKLGDYITDLSKGSSFATVGYILFTQSLLNISELSEEEKENVNVSNEYFKDISINLSIEENIFVKIPAKNVKLPKYSRYLNVISGAVLRYLPPVKCEIKTVSSQKILEQIKLFKYRLVEVDCKENVEIDEARIKKIKKVIKENEDFFNNLKLKFYQDMLGYSTT